MVAIDGELIRMPAEAGPGPRRRLLIGRSFEGAERIPVRVTSLCRSGCDLAGLQSIGDVDGRLWLRLSGFEPFQIIAIEDCEGRLKCLFAQPLSSAVVNALSHPVARKRPAPPFQLRCTFL